MTEIGSPPTLANAHPGALAADAALTELTMEAIAALGDAALMDAGAREAVAAAVTSTRLCAVFNSIPRFTPLLDRASLAREERLHVEIALSVLGP